MKVVEAIFQAIDFISEWTGKLVSYALIPLVFERFSCQTACCAGLCWTASSACGVWSAFFAVVRCCFCWFGFSAHSPFVA